MPMLSNGISFLAALWMFVVITEQTATASGGKVVNAHSPFVITGDMSCGGDSLDPTPTIDSTVPMTVGCLITFHMGAG